MRTISKPRRKIKILNILGRLLLKWNELEQNLLKYCDVQEFTNEILPRLTETKKQLISIIEDSLNISFNGKREQTNEAESLSKCDS